MRVWLACFLVLFGAAELLQWMDDLRLPMPIFVLGGAFLAIASNYTKLANLPFHPDYDESNNDAQPVVTQAQPNKTMQPSSQSSAKFGRPISFEIQKPFNPGD
jgi:hypothetical protein